MKPLTNNIKNTITILVLFFASSHLYTQSFEGKIVYEVSFEINKGGSNFLGVDKVKLITALKASGEFYDEISIYIDCTGYVKTDNSTLAKKIIYKSDDNIISFSDNQSEVITTINANSQNAIYSGIDFTILHIPDTTKIILGDTCHLLEVNWNSLGYEHYWYSKDCLPIEPHLFEEHDRELLNLILLNTEAYPMEISKTLGSFLIITMTATKIEEGLIDTKIFETSSKHIRKNSSPH